MWFPQTEAASLPWASPRSLYLTPVDHIVSGWGQMQGAPSFSPGKRGGFGRCNRSPVRSLALGGFASPYPGTTMDQARSSRLSDELSDKWSRWDTGGNGDPHETRRNARSVKAAVFNQCLDFLPDESVAEVIEHGEGSPVLLVVDGDSLYVLSVSSPGTGEGPATTECGLHHINPERSTVTCQTKFIGERVGEATLPRETTWVFEVGSFKIRFQTLVNPEHDRLGDGETVAQELAKAIGWKELP